MFWAKTLISHWLHFRLGSSLFQEIAQHNMPADKEIIVLLDHKVIVYINILTWAWYNPKHLGLCKGMRTLIKNCLCSTFKGNANPLMMLQKKKITINNKWRFIVLFNSNNNRTQTFQVFQAIRLLHWNVRFHRWTLEIYYWFVFG